MDCHSIAALVGASKQPLGEICSLLLATYAEDVKATRRLYLRKTEECMSRSVEEWEKLPGFGPVYGHDDSPGELAYDYWQTDGPAQIAMLSAKLMGRIGPIAACAARFVGASPARSEKCSA